LLEIIDLTAGYGKIPIIRGINIKVEKGEVVAILGPNGAGKSTLLNTILNLTTIFNGIIRFNNIILNEMKPYEIAKLGIGIVPQIDNIFPNLTVDENLALGAYLRRGDPNVTSDVGEVLTLFPELAKRRRQKAKTLSGGERQMLAIARALLAKPSLLLLDEPTAGLAPRLASEVVKKIKEISESARITILIAEQNVKKALEIANRAYVLVGGEIIGSYTREEFSITKIEKMFFTGKQAM
jgi:branched-chain amino acid transport system ATP-binding protein